MGTFKVKSNGNLSIDLTSLLDGKDDYEAVEPGALDWSNCLAKSIMDSQDEEDPED